MENKPTTENEKVGEWKMQQIKFRKYFVTNGIIKAKVSYSIDNRADKRKCVTIYANNYGNDLNKIFRGEAQNDSDIQSDYCEKSRVVLFESHPLYEKLLHYLNRK